MSAGVGSSTTAGNGWNDHQAFAASGDIPPRVVTAWRGSTAPRVIQVVKTSISSAGSGPPAAGGGICSER